jgi:hypothetical protein
MWATAQYLSGEPRNDEGPGDLDREKAALAPGAVGSGLPAGGHGRLRGGASPAASTGPEARGTGFARLLIESRGGAPPPVPRP